jgi:hypothetical protein
MKVFRSIALLGTALGVAVRALRYWRKRQSTRRDQALFSDVPLPPVAESPRFPAAQ